MIRRFLLFSCLFFIFFLYGCIGGDGYQSSQQSSSGKDCNKVFVYNVIDGDTFSIAGEQSVRLIGIDAPEISHPDQKLEFYAKQSTQKLKDLIEKENVCLKKDTDKTQNKDKYGRLLRYVRKGDKFINRIMVKSGYAHAYTKYPFDYLEEFRKYEKQARKKRLGLWNAGKKLDFQQKNEKTKQLENECENLEDVICPDEAINHIGERKTVMFRVKGSHDTGRTIFLNSMRDYEDKKNFTAVIFSEYRGNFAEGIEDKLRGEVVRVKGEIQKYENRAEIVLKTSSQLEY